MTTQLIYAKDLFNARKWYDLVPDGSHTFMTAGYGTYNDNRTHGEDVLQSDYATAAVTADGTLGMAYVPTARTITVDMRKMVGDTTARWFDPSNNTFTAINGSPFANTGSTQLTTPGANHDGDNDWVLVLEATAPQPPQDNGNNDNNGGTGGTNNNGSGTTPSDTTNSGSPSSSGSTPVAATTAAATSTAAAHNTTVRSGSELAADLLSNSDATEPASEPTTNQQTSNQQGDQRPSKASQLPETSTDQQGQQGGGV